MLARPAGTPRQRATLEYGCRVKGSGLEVRIRSERGPLTCLNSMQDREPTVWRTVPEDR